MGNLTDHCRNVLAGVLPSRRDLLERAWQSLTPESFVDPKLCAMFQMLGLYYDKTGDVLTRSALEDIMNNSKADAGSVAYYLENFDLLLGMTVDESSFLWSLQQVRELSAERYTSEALVQAMEILNQGSKDTKGNILKGHQEARTYVLSQFAEIEGELTKQEAPEGDTRKEGNDVLEEYARAKHLALTGQSEGLKFGIPSLDNITGGLLPGELDLIVGYTSAGKTSFLVNLAWHAAMAQGKNVVIATTETLRPQVRRKLYCRHSRLPMFGLPEGLDSARVRGATLSSEEETVFQAVVDDYNNNPAYGHVYVMQVPHGATMAVLESRLLRVHRREFPIHFVGIDSLQLLSGEKKRDSDREEQSNIVKGAKRLAVTFDDGKGVCVASPWQVNRTNRDTAEKMGHYTLQATSETAESSNSADVILSLLEPSDAAGRYVDLRAQVLKNRDGARSAAQTTTIRADYATSYFTAGSAGDALAAWSGSNNQGSSLFTG